MFAGRSTVCLLDYPYLKKHYKMIPVDLSKQKVVDTDPKAIQQIKFTGKHDSTGKNVFHS